MHTPEIKFAIVNPQELVRIAEIYSILENVNLGALNLVTYALDRSVLNFACRDQKNINRLRKYFKGISGQTNVPIAAAVTAYSRMIINGFKLLALEKGLELYYSDTDSIVVNGPLPSEHCDSAKLACRMLKLELIFSV
jgi:hypothetical protein